MSLGILNSLEKAEDCGIIQPLDWFELLPKELIKDIPGYEELYQVTSFGRIWAVKRQIWLQLNINKYGYTYVYLYRNKKRTYQTVHRLVLMAFDRMPKAFEETRHLDGVRINNNILNLKWGDIYENTEDRQLHGTQYVGSNSGAAYLCEKDIIEIREKYSTGDYTYKMLMKEYSVCKSTISYIINNRTWQHVTT